MFSKLWHSKRDTGRSGLVRSALEKLPLFSPTFSARQKHGAGNFAVCGQRLRGHVPSKNTSPAALSWSSLFGATVLKSFRFRTMLCVVCFCRDTACRVRRFQQNKNLFSYQRIFRWKRSAGTFPKLWHSKRDTGRSGLVRSALEKLPLFSPTFSARQKHGAGNFAVCGQRLRGHVPSKNTSPAALSWSSLFGTTVLKSFRFRTMLFVPCP